MIAPPLGNSWCSSTYSKRLEKFNGKVHFTVINLDFSNLLGHGIVICIAKGPNKASYHGRQGN